MVKFIKAPSCIGCAHHQRWSQASNYDTVVTEFDRCAIMEATDSYGFISSVLHGRAIVDPSDCKMRTVKEIIKNSRLWVSLYFKGRERDWIVIEEGRHEVLIQGNWFVRKVFGMADKFHAWQDKRREKKWLAAEAKRKAAVLTHIVKELPRA